MAALAFLVRFDAALVLPPVLVIHALGLPGERLRRLLRVLLPLAVTIALWSLYCRIDHGTARFWGHAVAVNVETGLGTETGLSWLLAGLQVSGALFFEVLPSRIGWGIWGGGLLSVLVLPWTRHGLARTWLLLAGSMLGMWLGIGLIGQHEPGHNLYWKWLAPIIPVLIPLGVTGLWALLSPRRWGRWLLALLIVQAAAAELKETHRQWALSESWYRPQLQLAQWIEAEVPEDMVLVLDNIPACWIDRRIHERRLVSWFDVPTEGEAAFSEWLRSEEVGWVLWFREDWTQAPRVAPFLAAGGFWEFDGVSLTEDKREDGYGWILFQVSLDPLQPSG